MRTESPFPGPARASACPIASGLPAPEAHAPSPADSAARGRLHELIAAAPGDAPATAAAALLMAHAAAPERPIAWLRLQSAERLTGRLHGPWNRFRHGRS